MLGTREHPILKKGDGQLENEAIPVHDVFPRAVVSQTCLRNQQMFGSSTSFTSSILPTFHPFILSSTHIHSNPFNTCDSDDTTGHNEVGGKSLSLRNTLCARRGCGALPPEAAAFFCGFPLIVWDSSLNAAKERALRLPQLGRLGTGDRRTECTSHPERGVRARPCSVVSLSSYATSVLNGGALCSEDGWRARSY